VGAEQAHHVLRVVDRHSGLRALLRGGASDEELRASIRARWHARRDAYSELRGRPLQIGTRQKIEMSFIGG